MRRSMLGTTLAVIGGVLIVAGLILRFGIVPGFKQLPADTDETRTYAGTMHTLLNPQALADGDLANLFITDAPVELTRHVYVDTTEGGDALAIEEASAMLADGTPVAATTDTYAIDRHTMEHTDGFADDSRVQAREGLVIGWPIGTEKTDYTGWSDDIQSTVTVTYEGEETRADLDTYIFKSEVTPTAITDPATLAQLPPAIPQAVLQQLAAATPDALPVPAEQFGQILASMPDPVPMTYLYSSSTTYWVEPASGVIVELTRDETRQAALTVEGQPTPIPLATVFDWTYQQTPDSVADAAADARDARATITLYETTLPFIAYGVGLLLVIAGLWLARSRKQDGPVIEIPSERVITLQDKPPVQT